MHKPFKSRDPRLIRSGPFNEVPPTPNQLRWRAMPIPSEPTDFIDGVVTIGGNGDPACAVGCGNSRIWRQYFYAGPVFL